MQKVERGMLACTCLLVYFVSLFAFLAGTMGALILEKDK